MENNSEMHQENLMLSKARDTAYSPEEAEEYDARRFVPKYGQCIHASEFQQLRSALRNVEKTSSVLEVGCGTGRFLIELRKQGYQVDGVDASGAMLEQVKNKLRENELDAKLVLAQAANIPVPECSYDFVFSIRLLNQTESPAYALSVITEMIRITRPGGYVLAEFVNDFRPRWGAANKKTTRLKPRQVIDHVKECDANFVYCTGCFLLSMQAYTYIPGFLLRPFMWFDRFWSSMLPRMCSRCYVLIQRKAPA